MTAFRHTLLNKNACKIRGKFGAVLAISLGNLLGFLFLVPGPHPQIERLSSATPTLSNGITLKDK